jgi:hypothetical protein
MDNDQNKEVDEEILSEGGVFESEPSVAGENNALLHRQKSTRRNGIPSKYF